MTAILFRRCALARRELDYMADSLPRRHISGDDEYTWRYQQLLEPLAGLSKALLTTSCTVALEPATLLLGQRLSRGEVLREKVTNPKARARPLRIRRLGASEPVPSCLRRCRIAPT